MECVKGCRECDAINLQCLRRDLGGTCRIHGLVTIRKGEITDGFHSFNDLYAHRRALFIAHMRNHPMISWRANNHHDGTSLEGWFIAGMHLPSGDISYHLPADDWYLLDGYGIATTNIAPEWDGHTPQDVIQRLLEWGEIVGTTK